MEWPRLSRNADKELTHYVIDKLAQSFDVEIPLEDTLHQPDGIPKVAEAIYASLSKRNIFYALEPHDADQRRQSIRSPETILGGAKEGTCLDLALLFAGIALGKGLAPLVVMLEGHAFVAVSLRYLRRTASDMPRLAYEGDWLKDGVLRDVDKLKEFIDKGDYVAIECTGFAQSKILAASAPESMGRVEGRLGFDAATKAGRAQLDYAARPFRFAIDIAVLRDLHGSWAYELPLAGGVSKYRPRLERLMEDYPLFGGRDAEFQWLHNALTKRSHGYAFLTGTSGSGKTAFLVNWLRMMLARKTEPAHPIRIAYYFISRNYELAEEQSFFELLCEQLQRAHSISDPLPKDVPGLQAKYLELLARPVSNGSIVVVIDGLDEAQGWVPNKVLFPRELPIGVHVVFTARDIADCNWLAMFDLDVTKVPTLKLGPLKAEAVRDLLRSVSPPLSTKADDDAFVKALHKVSTGDPFYLKLLLEDLAKLPAPSVADIEAKPPKLKDYLDQWWNEVAKQGKADKSVRDLLTYLVVALGPLGRDDLVEIDKNDALNSFTVDDAVNAVKRYLIGNSDIGYSLCHPRFHDYLVTDRVRPIDQRPYHERLTKWCEAAWNDSHPRYALAHVIDHLAAKRRGKTPGKRGAVTAQMLSIVTDAAFRERKLGSPSGSMSYKYDLRVVVVAAATDPLPDALLQLVPAALGLAEAHRSPVSVADLFNAARDGRPELAAQQLQGVVLDSDWHRAGLLMLAWLCVRRDIGKARQFLRSYRAMLQPYILSNTLKLLYDRTVAAIQGGSPLLQLPYPPGELHKDVSLERIRTIVVRIGGSTDQKTIATPIDPNMVRGLGHFGDKTPTYTAESDSPWLVGYAVTNPEEGQTLVRSYIRAHAENPYRVYRDRSLWHVLGAVLCHPNADWALDVARAVCEVAFQPAVLEYREMLYLAATALAAKLGDGTAAKLLGELVAQARFAASNLQPFSRESDSWGFHRRRLAALAECLALTDGDIHHIGDLVQQVSRLPFGYAGFHAPANLAVADAVFVCQPDEQKTIDHFLESARQAAHNVQDGRFCARTTSRVNAIVRRWRPGTIGDLAATIEQFVSNPLAARFAPVHIVGEQYKLRSAQNSLPIPNNSRRADTLAQIALDAYGIPAAGFASLNADVQPDVRLSLGTEVNVLDLAAGTEVNVLDLIAREELKVLNSGFAPLLAARFTAELLARRAELGGMAAALIAKLVPVAATNPTALDLVLGRMLLAAAPNDPLLLKRVADLAPHEWMRSPASNRVFEVLPF